ncbi:thiamine diphosphokinase [Bacteroides propionicifaciens]|jgi:thiamine pyrophosphokinase|uniref:thiamine diphosphokinase n=1 Tax=Bacteroides propionicifaciens TaxID=392838 RepID=UPI0003780158|nr:thiamine diphosphokinase [Bacteroides propionicifaciens]
MEKNKSAVVIANGSFPTDQRTLEWITKSNYIACCDGGADQVIEQGIIPDIIVGDGDSINSAYKQKYKDRLHLIADQETNDLTKTVTYLSSQGFDDITILGATGKREDHTLGNISLLLDYMKLCKVKMITDHGVFYPCQNEFEATIPLKSQLSIFNFGATDLRTEDLEYPIRDFTSWWQGTLNCTRNETVKIQANGNFLVFVAY